MRGFTLPATGKAVAFVTETELYAGAPRRTRRRSRTQGQFRQLAEGPHRTQGRRPGGARKPRHRPLSGSDPHGPRHRRAGIPRTALRQRSQALRAGGATTCDFALFRRRAGSRTAAYARFRPVGKSQAQGGRTGARHRGRTAGAVRCTSSPPGPCLRFPGKRL